jgi:hypothetical protein
VPPLNTTSDGGAAPVARVWVATDDLGEARDAYRLSTGGDCPSAAEGVEGNKAAAAAVTTALPPVPCAPALHVYMYAYMQKQPVGGH